MDAKVKYWTDLSDYDLETAQAMFLTKRFLYVGFMCHQTVEKILKAYYTKEKTETPPFSHSLSYLAKKCTLYNDFTEEQKNFIDQIEPLNIEARYPLHKERLLKSLTESKCSELLTETKLLQEWIKMRL